MVLEQRFFSRTYLSHGIILGVFTILAYYMFISTEKKRYIFISIFLLCIYLDDFFEGDRWSLAWLD
jgi:hypothetical protein